MHDLQDGDPNGNENDHDGQANVRVLILDDDPAIREIGSRILEMEGLEVRTAASGECAVDACRSGLAEDRRFAVVIADLCIPDSMRCEETLSALAALDPRLKVIIATGDASNPRLGPLAARGYCDVLLKPFAFSDLSRFVRSLIGGGAGKERAQVDHERTREHPDRSPDTQLSR